MKVKSFTLALMLCLVFAPSLPVMAQIAGGDQGWSTVQALTQGTRVSVKMKNGDTVEGDSGTVSDAGITVSRKNLAIILRRDDINKLYRVGGKQVVKTTLIGLGAGTAAGAAIGGVVAVGGGPHESGEAHLPVFILGAGGAIIGTAAGAVTGLFRRKKVLIYEAR